MEELWDIDQYCKKVKMTRGAAATQRYDGSGPPFIKISGKQVRYRAADVEKWLEERTFTRTDDRPPRTTR